MFAADLPDDDRLVVACGEHPIFFLCKHEGIDRAIMSFHLSRLSSECEVPDGDGAIGHGGIDMVSVGVPGDVSNVRVCLELVASLLVLEVPHFELCMFVGECEIALVVAPCEMLGK